VLGAPASKRALAMLERERGSPLPPLVRELLTAANGWRDVPMSTPPLHWFSCAELMAPAYGELVTQARATRGFTKDKDLPLAAMNHDVIDVGPRRLDRSDQRDARACRRQPSGATHANSTRCTSSGGFASWM
jgi:hypothetical protein